MILKSFAIITLFCIFSLNVHSLEYFNSPDDLITSIYLKNAFMEFESENYMGALKLADIALSFSENSSDALFLSARARKNLGISEDVQIDIKNAIIWNNWVYYDEITARVFLSELLYLNGYVQDAYLNLILIRNKLVSDSFFTELFIRISLNLGKIDEAVSIASEHLVINSNDKYSQFILARYDQNWLLDAQTQIENGDPAHYFNKLVFQELFYTGFNCEILRNLYLERFGDDRFSKISSLCISPDNLDELLIALYPDNSRIEHNELLWLLSIFNDGEIKNKILNKMNSISLEIEYDIDSNGFIDTTAQFVNGKLMTLSFDGNHDGVNDYFAEINELPVMIVIEAGSEKITLKYKYYPNLIEVIKENEISETLYELIPYKIQHDILTFSANLTEDIPFFTNYIIPGDNILTEVSTKKKIMYKENNLLSIYSITGYNQGIENVYNSDGIKILQRYYQDAVLITVHKDFDSDGIFDTVYEYKDGLLLTVLFDENNNGVYEYTENHYNDLIKTWDFNEDGEIDSKEYMENGVIIRSVSTNHDGVFDYSSIIESDKE
jgi:hypothetical protein